PESGRAVDIVRTVPGIICQSAKHDRLRGNENITSPTARPFMGEAKPSSRIPSLLRDANFFIVIKSLFPQFPDLIREEGMRFVNDQVGFHASLSLLISFSLTDPPLIGE